MTQTIRNNNTLLRQNRLGIYLFYDKDGIADDYIPYFLQRFKPFLKELCIVVNGKLTEASRQKLAPLADRLLVRENKGFDAWAYKYALEYYGWDKLTEYDEVILCNYTFFGPFYPLEKLFTDMDKKECDWWSLYKWYEPLPVKHQHMPSFWIAYRKSLVGSKDFRKYWETLHEINSYADSTIYHEQRQTPYYDQKGYRAATWIDHHKYKTVWEEHWPLSYADKTVIEDKCPFIKRRCFFIQDGKMPLAQVVQHIIPYLRTHTNYDLGLIQQNLTRTQNTLSLKRTSGAGFWLRAARYFICAYCFPICVRRRKYRMKLAAWLLDDKKFNNLLAGRSDGGKMTLLMLKLRLELLRLVKPVLGKIFFHTRKRTLERALLHERTRPAQNVNLQQFYASYTPSKAIVRPIDILIPVYNGYDVIGPCLESLLNNTDLPFHIYLADDASPDEKIWPLLRAYQTRHPDAITVVQNPENLGIIHTLNRLIALTKNDFLVLNTDTELPPGWASRLFKPIFENPHLAAAGPWSNAADKQSVYFRHEERPLPIPLKLADRQAASFAPVQITHIPTLVSFCMAISRRAAQQLGGLDPVYGKGYYDETDWLFRAKRAGYGFCLVPNVFVYHKGTASFPSKQKKELMRRNGKLFEKRFPGVKKTMRRAQYNPAFMALHFLMLAKCLRAQYPALIPAPAAKRPGETAFFWRKDRDAYLYELYEKEEYEALYSSVTPDEMERLTRPV